MSDLDAGLDPAIGLLEFDSVAAGIVAGDAMAKASPIAALYAGTVHPGRYLVLVGGATAEVEVALEAGITGAVADQLLLPDVHSDVIAAITSSEVATPEIEDALGIVETSTSASAIVAADSGIKAAEVRLLAVRLADDLGGRAYCLFTGLVADVEIAVERASAVIEAGDRLVAGSVISQLHGEMRDNLTTELRFNPHLRRGGSP